MKKYNCEQAYTDNYKIIKEKLNAISRLMVEHKETFLKKSCGVDWGFVGDLDRNITKLDDIIDSLKVKE